MYKLFVNDIAPINRTRKVKIFQTSVAPCNGGWMPATEVGSR